MTYIATEVDGHWGIQARFGAGAPLPADQERRVADIAIAKVEEYMSAVNARDPAGWAATLNYPHLRIASGELRVSETEEELASQMNFDAFAERFGWDHSECDDIEAVQVAENGVNVAMTFSRYNADDEVISTFNTLYLVTNENGRWGTAPALRPSAAHGPSTRYDPRPVLGHRQDRRRRHGRGAAQPRRKCVSLVCVMGHYEPCSADHVSVEVER